ncbi:MAG: response regulator [Rhodospirillales bacterium]
MRSYDLSGLEILLVEKHFLIRRMLTDIFGVMGVPTVHTTNSVEAGWELFDSQAPDILLTDWNNELNGIELLHRVRRDPDSPDPYCPVVVVTANTELRHVCTARDKGMTEFLAKPVSAKLLYGRICSVIESNRVFVRSENFFGPDRRRARHVNYGGPERRAA